MTDAEFQAELDDNYARLHARMDRQAREIMALFEAECHWIVVTLKCLPIAFLLATAWMVLTA